MCFEYADYYLLKNGKMKKRIFSRLKTKAASLGFNTEELKGVAAVIADNLDSEEATDEDIDAQIDAVLPLLKVGQQQAQRIAKATKPVPAESGDDDDTDASATDKSPKKTDDKNDGEPEWFRKYREQQESRFAALEADKTASARQAKLESMLKDTGKFGERTLKNFARMKFDKDADFDDFLSDVESDLEELKQEEGDENISTVTKPPGGGDGKAKKDKPLTDAEINDIAAGIY
jgi:hypothetical protein